MVETVPLSLLADRVAPARLAALANGGRYGVAEAPSATTITVSGDATAAWLAALLEAGQPFGIEDGVRDLWLDRVAVLRRDPTCLLAWSFTTATLMTQPMTQAIGHWTIAHLGLSDAKGLDLELALTEAVSNACLHGNLTVTGGLRHAHAHRRFVDQIEALLGNPSLRALGVLIAVRKISDDLVIDVWQEGDWRDADLPLPIAPGESDPVNLTPSGRGHRLLAALAKELHRDDERRRLTLVFGLD